MNRLISIQGRRLGAFAMFVLIPLTLAACASGPESPQAAAEARSNLDALKNEPELAALARMEVREAEEAVSLAEQPVSGGDSALVEHRVYLAEQRVEIARARATARHAESERPRLAQERDDARLAARTREADQARSAQAASAAGAEREAQELQRQIDTLKAESTERGVVLTLSDVLFATDSAELQAGAGRNLDQLVDFLNEYPERTLLVEGHTDSTGNADYNRRLSQQRADSVRNHLAGRGIANNRVSTAGLGEDRPIADNSTAAGRQQNRRVEIIIAHGARAEATREP